MWWRSNTLLLLSLLCLHSSLLNAKFPNSSEESRERRRYNAQANSTPTVSSNLPQSFYRETQEREALNCEELGDGNYVFGCSERFWTCRGKQGFLMQCPEGLFYNPLKNQCQYIQNVELCKNDKLRDSLIPQKGVAEFSCVGKKDGFYTKGYCDGNYIRCHDGYLYNHRCPSNLEFDETQIACVDRKDVKRCRTVRRMSYNSYQKQQRKPCLSGKCQQSETEEVDCSILPDGTYPPKGLLCKDHFYKCTSGKPSFMKCPIGLIYSVETQQCDKLENISECEYVIGQITHSKHVVHHHHFDQHRPSHHQHVKPVPVPKEQPISCAGKADGFYTDAPCTPSFYQCSSEYSFSQICPSGFVFDVPSKQCVVVDKCRKAVPRPHVLPTYTVQKPITQAPTTTTTTTTTTTSAPYVPVQTTSVPYVPVQTTSTSSLAPVDNFCSDKADGHYSLGCTSEYYVCSSSQAYKMKCAGSTVFDKDTNACEIRNHVVECGGTKPAADSTTPAPVVVKDTFCESKADGVYADGCQNEYYVCNGGFAFKNSCPPGLVFSVEDDACLYKKHVVACGGSPVAKDATTLAPTVAVDLYCNGKADGYHSDQCSDVFYYCSAGFGMKQTCPIGLFFDVQHEQCDHKEEISACGGQKSPPTTTTTPKPYPQVPNDPFCNGKADGYYADGCSSTYYACTGGFTTKMQCVEGTFYDATENKCFVKEECPACGGTLPTSAPQMDARPVDTFCVGKEDGYYSDRCASTFYSCEGEFGEKQSCPPGLYFDPEFHACDYQDQITTCGGQRTTQAPTPTYAPVSFDPFCVGKSDGYHVEGCSSVFYGCVGEVTTKMFCPDGLFYDVKENECLPKEEASTCGGTKKVYDYVDETTSADHGVIDTFCNDKSDGFYDFECSSDYYNCFGGFGQKQTCPPGTKFDKETNECNFATEIVACGGKPSPKVEQPVYAPIEVNPFCVGKENGYYALECSAKYYSCLDEIAVQMSCPTGLVYDDKHQQCLTPEEATACGGTGPTVFTPVAIVSDVGVVDTYCKGKADGYYSDECDNWFYNCVSEYGNKVTCPTGLMFDKTTSSCELKKYAISCGGVQRPKPTAFTSAVSVPNDPFCVGKGNGYYAEGCTNIYYGCNNGVTQKMSCPPNTFYDDEINACSFKSEVPACGGTRPSKVAESPSALLQPSAYCEGKSNGKYVDGCQTYFIYCNGPYAERIECPAGLYYDQANEQCGGRSSIAACGGVTPTQFTTVYPRPVQVNVCDKKDDGIYCKGCARECLKCQSQQAVKFTCPTDLYYDEEIKSCAPKNTIPVCGGTRPITTTPALTTTVAPELSSDLVQGKPCDPKKWLKPLGQACGTEFFSCHNNKVIKFVCPQNQKFDQKFGGCRMRQHCPWCWESKPTVHQVVHHHHIDKNHGHHHKPHHHGHNQKPHHHGQQPYIRPQTQQPQTRPQVQQKPQQEQPKVGYGLTEQTYTKRPGNGVQTTTQRPMFVTSDKKEIEFVQTILNDTSKPFIKEEKTRFCENVYAGIYFKKCSPFYLVCSARGRHFVSTCPSGKYWSGKSASCDPIEQMTECKH
uniref:Chondroitin proteoglycan 2 n=1 Tax=Parastrongyloides trichosuri TaxID=131310 RepID=A0A0N5A312_PARTI